MHQVDLNKKHYDNQVCQFAETNFFLTSSLVKINVLQWKVTQIKQKISF